MRRPRLLAVAAALALAASACSPGGDGAGDGAAGAPAPRPTTTTTPATTSTVPATTTTTVPVVGLPASAEEAAAVLRASGEVIAAGDVASAAFALAAKREQAAYRAVAAHPEWDAAVRAGLPDALRPAFDANVTAARELRALTAPRTELPAWQIVAPAPAGELLSAYRNAEAATGVPWEYLAAIHLVETRMGRIRGTSPAGAKGPMQFLPSTWAAYGEGDIESNHDAIRAAARYLARNGAPRNMANALWNYNHSDHYVRAVSRYAEQMCTRPHAFEAYWHWDVYYRLVTGDELLPVGWTKPGTPSR